MDTFAVRFEKMLLKEKEAARLVEGSVSRGIKRENLIFLLDWATSPYVAQGFQKSYVKIKNRLLPSRKRTSAVAARMEDLAREIEEIFSHPLYALLSKSQRLTEIAQVLRTEAVTVRKFPRARIAKLFSNKSLWKHVPISLLCRLLDVSKTCSYSEAERLLWYGFLARGVEQRVADRGLEREVRRFEKSPAGKLFHYLLLQGTPKESPGGKLLYPLLRRIEGQKHNKYLLWARMMD
jgi:hypothetical protein